MGEPEFLERAEQFTAAAVRQHFLQGLAAIEDSDTVESIPDLSRAVVSYKDLLAMQLPVRSQHLPWLPEAANVMVYGPRGVGKTMFQLGLAAALTTGQDFFGWTVAQPVGVLYIDGSGPT